MVYVLELEYARHYPKPYPKPPVLYCAREEQTTKSYFVLSCQVGFDLLRHRGTGNRYVVMWLSHLRIRMYYVQVARDLWRCSKYSKVAPQNRSTRSTPRNFTYLVKIYGDRSLGSWLEDTPPAQRVGSLFLPNRFFLIAQKMTEL